MLAWAACGEYSCKRACLFTPLKTFTRPFQQRHPANLHTEFWLHEATLCSPDERRSVAIRLKNRERGLSKGLLEASRRTLKGASYAHTFSAKESTVNTVGFLRALLKVAQVALAWYTIPQLPIATARSWRPRPDPSLRQCDETTASTGKSQKEGQEEQAWIKELRGAFLVV